MSKKIYAFVVGINDYPNPKHKLKGAVPDTKKIVTFLEESFPKEKLAVKLLTDEEATYQNVVNSFREHLGQATEEDTCWFHYSGHGARQPTAPEFEPFTPGKMDETLVLYDSRPNGKDLADRELGLLIAEIEKTGAHILVSLDCCHSGSGTREMTEIAPDYIERLTEDKAEKRTLDSYLDGFYVKNGLQSPSAKHILLAACNPLQTAKETYTSSGVFTDNLIKTLKYTGTDISYADLFVRLRQGVISNNIPNQDPQLELIGGTSGYVQFLNGATISSPKKIPVYLENRNWVLGAGAIQGLQNAVEANTEIQIYREEEEEPFTTATVTSVSFQKCVLNPKEKLVEDVNYWGLPSKLPLVAEKVYFEQTWDTIDTYRQELEQHSGLAMATEKEKHFAAYAFKLNDNLIELWHVDKAELLQKARLDDPDAAHRLFGIINQVALWKRLFSLQNSATKIDTTQVAAYIEIKDAANQIAKFEPGDIHLADVTKKYPFNIMVHNRLKQTLHYCLFYLSEDYGITSLKNETIEFSDSPTVFWGGSADDYFFLEPEQKQSKDTFLMIISTERTDDFELVCEGIDLGALLPDNMFRGVAGISKFTPLKGEWFTQKFIIRMG